jgi:hypothetical protein
VGPKPTLLEMTICELVVIEPGTDRASKINSFSTLPASHFPFDPGRFFVFAEFTDSKGGGDLMLSVTYLPTGQDVYASLEPIAFMDRLQEVRVILQPSPFAFPQPGPYLFALWVDDDEVAARRVHVY